MAKLRLLSPADLLINPANPRLPTPNLGQREALRELAKHLGRQLLALSADIVNHGLNPSDLPIVMPTGDDTKRYLVLEGNRRLAALRILENPEIILGAVDNNILAAMRTHGVRDHHMIDEVVPPVVRLDVINDCGGCIFETAINNMQVVVAVLVVAVTDADRVAVACTNLQKVDFVHGERTRSTPRRRWRTAF
jgi:hypothetical protein